MTTNQVLAEQPGLAPDAVGDAGPIGIVCGGGPLPRAVAEAARRAGRDVYLVLIEGFAKSQGIEAYRHDWVKLGQSGRALNLLQAAGCRDVVLIGPVRRPSLRQVRLDWFTVRMLPRVIAMFRGGDDRLLRGVGRILEEKGLRLIGAHEVAPGIVIPEGPLGRLKPSTRDAADAARGFAVIAAIGAFDIGQAVVVADNHVVAVEGIEGTDSMLARVADLRAQGTHRLALGGVLVKAPKPGQDRRFDLPTVGPKTVENARRAGLAGIAVHAGEVLVIEPQAMVDAADAAGLFVAGFPTDPASSS